MVLDTGKIYNRPERIQFYREIAKWMISDYIEQKDWGEKADQYYDRVKEARRESNV